MRKNSQIRNLNTRLNHLHQVMICLDILVQEIILDSDIARDWERVDEFYDAVDSISVALEEIRDEEAEIGIGKEVWESEAKSCGDGERIRSCCSGGGYRT